MNLYLMDCQSNFNILLLARVTEYENPPPLLFNLYLAAISYILWGGQEIKSAESWGQQLE